VIDDDKMKDLMASIQINGILNPVIVRPDDEDGYEMISGHRRLFVAKALGLKTVPAFVREMTDDDAVIAMVDSNIQREEILPSEKAFAYKLKYEAMRRSAGRPSAKNASQNGTHLRSDEELVKQVGESRNQVQRYMRLTELIEDLLDLVDQNRIAVTTGVDISYIDKEIQGWLYEYIRENGVIKAPQITTLRQAVDGKDNLTQKQVIEILNENLPGKAPTQKVSFSSKKLHKYFPAYYSSKEIEDILVGLMEKWKEEQGGEMNAV